MAFLVVAQKQKSHERRRTVVRKCLRGFYSIYYIFDPGLNTPETVMF